MILLLDNAQKIGDVNGRGSADGGDLSDVIGSSAGKLMPGMLIVVNRIGIGLSYAFAIIKEHLSHF